MLRGLNGTPGIEKIVPSNASQITGFALVEVLSIKSLKTVNSQVTLLTFSRHRFKWSWFASGLNIVIISSRH